MCKYNLIYLLQLSYENTLTVYFGLMNGNLLDEGITRMIFNRTE